jgi:pimeloyl-ACP methyl ester carboxylesterase
MGQFTPEMAKLSMAKMPPLNTLDAKYTLNLYKVTYHTSAPDGQPTFASGFVTMPIATDKKPAIISYFHGTRVNRNDVPSRNDEKNYIYPAVFGSHAGYMVVMPDYLGLGDNDLPIHPYVDSKTLASSSIDMLIAAKELAASLNYKISNKLFLAGYSEGGYTTTVTYEELLKNHKELPVTAVSPGSAPYDYDETMRFVALEPGPRAAAYFAYFFYSLQTYHHYWSGLNEIFNQPYETLVPNLLDGYHQTAEIMQALPTDPRQLLKPAFFDAFIKGTEEHTAELRREFNHYDFTSTSPLLMVGTKGDHDVPYHGAEIAYEVFKSKSNQVYIKHVSEVLDHLQAFPLVTKAQLEFFDRYN